MENKNGFCFFPENLNVSQYYDKSGIKTYNYAFSTWSSVEMKLDPVYMCIILISNTITVVKFAFVECPSTLKMEIQSITVKYHAYLRFK
jgi:hypothetical protein